MDLRKLKTLIDLVSESTISELEITEAEGKVRIVKAPAAALAAALPLPIPPAAAAPVTGVPTPPAAQAPATAVPVEPAAVQPDGKVIKSPMVGTFYRSPSPGAKAFVEVGSDVKAGDPVCIIEAMKIMNEVESDVDGRIAKILVDNGQAVEFGQPLFVVE
jgi:acetyl-CoA carboxylase biotin carboxyl carrier protein